MATSEHQICSKLGQQEVDHHPIRRSSGRRKVKVGGGDPKKANKPRQRGMGMEKLEQQRLKELLESTDQPAFHPPYPNLDPTRNPTAFHALIGDERRLLNSHLLGNDVKCYSLHCNACHKKKKINGEDLGKTLENQNLMNGSSIGARVVGNYGNKVEVVAVHRRGSSNGWDGGNNGVLMEYDFFPPAKSGASFGSEEMVCGTSSSMPGFDVDLSLKLSY